MFKDKVSSYAHYASDRVAPYAASARKYTEDNILPHFSKFCAKASEKIAPYGESMAEAMLPYAEKIREFADDIEERTDSFSPIDWVIFKVMIGSICVLLGAALSKVIKKLAPPYHHSGCCNHNIHSLEAIFLGKRINFF